MRLARIMQAMKMPDARSKLSLHAQLGGSWSKAFLPQVFPLGP